jgi:hypothetical protein
VVSGQRITIKSSTRVNQMLRQRKWAVGRWSKRQKNIGRVAGQRDHVIRGAKRRQCLREFSGAIESIGADLWVIGGSKC